MIAPQRADGAPHGCYHPTPEAVLSGNQTGNQIIDPPGNCSQIGSGGRVRSLGREGFQIRADAGRPFQQGRLAGAFGKKHGPGGGDEGGVHLKTP